MTGESTKTDCMLIGGPADGETISIGDRTQGFKIPHIVEGRFDSAIYERSGPAEFRYAETLLGSPTDLEEASSGNIKYVFDLRDRVAALETANARLRGFREDVSNKFDRAGIVDLLHDAVKQGVLTPGALSAVLTTVVEASRYGVTSGRICGVIRTLDV